MLGVRDEPAPPGEFNERNAFLNQATGNREQVPAIRLGEPSVPFSKVRRDGQSGTVELVD
jgi:hypothetical protein